MANLESPAEDNNLMALRTDDENILQEKRRLMLNQTEVQDNASGDKAGGEGIY